MDREGDGGEGLRRPGSNQAVAPLKKKKIMKFPRIYDVKNVDAFLIVLLSNRLEALDVSEGKVM